MPPGNPILDTLRERRKEASRAYEKATLRVHHLETLGHQPASGDALSQLALTSKLIETVALAAVGILEALEGLSEHLRPLEALHEDQAADFDRVVAQLEAIRERLPDRG